MRAPSEMITLLALFCAPVAAALLLGRCGHQGRLEGGEDCHQDARHESNGGMQDAQRNHDEGANEEVGQSAAPAPMGDHARRDSRRKPDGGEGGECDGDKEEPGKRFGAAWFDLVGDGEPADSEGDYADSKKEIGDGFHAPITPDSPRRCNTILTRDYNG